MAQRLAAVATKQLERGDWQQWINSLDAFLFDCDGVLWRGNAPIAGAGELVGLLRSLGKRVVFVTNNSTTSRDNYVKKLGVFPCLFLLLLLLQCDTVSNDTRVHASFAYAAKQGIPAAVDEIVTSAWATAVYMKNEKITGKVYFVGEAGLGQELANEGFEAFGLEHGDVKEFPTPFTIDKDVKAVVVGLDRNISYYKLAYATACVRQIPGCRFIGTNPDPTFPVDGAILPGGGTLVKTIESGVGHAPEAVIGKPSQDLLKTILATYNLDPSRTCMVGDRLSTDIAFGRLGGLQTLLVLTGVTHESELATIELPEFTPHHYVQSVDVLNQLYQQNQN